MGGGWVRGGNSMHSTHSAAVVLHRVYLQLFSLEESFSTIDLLYCI